MQLDVNTYTYTSFPPASLDPSPLTRVSKPDEVKDWLLHYKGGIFATFVDVFAGLDGKELFALTKDEVTRLTKDSVILGYLWANLYPEARRGITSILFYSYSILFYVILFFNLYISSSRLY